MTRKTPLLAGTLSLLALAGCSDAHDDLARSEAAWAVTKKTCSTYQYEIRDVSFSGFWSDTTIQISNDQPVLRTFTSGDTSPVDGTRTTTTMWSESGAAIGTHDDGAPPARTMEQLYATCDRDVLTQDPSKNDVQFTADARGVLTSCTYTPRGCQDDCVFGVGAANFACIGLE